METGYIKRRSEDWTRVTAVYANGVFPVSLRCRQQWLEAATATDTSRPMRRPKYSSVSMKTVSKNISQPNPNTRLPSRTLPGAAALRYAAYIVAIYWQHELQQTWQKRT